MRSNNEVAVIGYNCATGLGQANWDLFRLLPCAKWVVLEHPQYGIDRSRLTSNCVVVPWIGTEQAHVSDPDGRYHASSGDLADYLQGTAAVVIVERLLFDGLLDVFRKTLPRIYLIVNEEWLDWSDEVLELITTFIAPTRSCYSRLVSLGLGERSTYVPYPIDTDRFVYTKRSSVDFISHYGGRPSYWDRKGTELVIGTAALLPDSRFHLHTQFGLSNYALPPNVVPCGSSARAEDLYSSGAVAFQPSRFEGVGLQLLEAMACGLVPLVPRWPPMQEYAVTTQTLLPGQPRVVSVGGRPWVAFDIDTHEAANVIGGLRALDIGALSERCAEFAAGRSWHVVGGSLRQIVYT